METKSNIQITEEQVAQRLDAFLHESFELSRSYAKELVEEGHVLVNSKQVKASYKLKLGDDLDITIPEAQEIDIIAQDIPLDIVYEDEDLAVINKPIGMVTHPAPGLYEDTLVNALLFHFKDSLSVINGKQRPGIVHRLDKDTSGLILVAKNNESHESLANQIQEKTCKRFYHALVQGKFKQESKKAIEINKPIGRDPKQRNKMAVITSPNVKSRPAVTYAKVLEHLSFKEASYSYVECELKTGRTHQVRVHLSSLRYPILGDLTYGAKRNTHIKIERPLLHAKKISFMHPKTKQEMFFEIDLADDFDRVLNILRNQ